MPRAFITLVLLLAAGAIAVLYVGGAWERNQAIRRELADLEGISAELDNLLQNRDTLIERVNTISGTDLERMETAVPDGPHAAEFLVLLEALSVKHGLVFQKIDLASFAQEQEKKERAKKPQPEKTGEPEAEGEVLPSPKPGSLPLPRSREASYREFPFAFSVVGTYEAFKDFLGDLERNLRFIEVGEIFFVPAGGAARGNQPGAGGGAEKTSVWTFNVKAKTYYQ
jgi:hypothetical protein